MRWPTESFHGMSFSFFSGSPWFLRVSLFADLIAFVIAEGGQIAGAEHAVVERICRIEAILKATICDNRVHLELHRVTRLNWGGQNIEPVVGGLFCRAEKVEFPAGKIERTGIRKGSAVLFELEAESVAIDKKSVDDSIAVVSERYPRSGFFLLLTGKERQR